jgi:hypothetical protein
VYKYIRMCADKCKVQLQQYLMCVYRDSGAVHFTNSHCYILTGEMVNGIEMCCGSVCAHKRPVSSVVMEILAKQKVPNVMFSCDILLC